MRGIAWTGGAKWTTQVIGWSSTLLVAHLLGPDPYGLLGMATIFLGLVSTLTEFGLGTAVVSLRTLSERQLAQLTSLSIVLGVAGALLTCAAAWPLGWIYREPQLPWVVVAISGNFLLSAIRVIPAARLQRDLEFRRLAILETAQSTVLAVANVTFAYLGFGVWTLVWGSIVSQVAGTTLTWMARPGRFAMPTVAGLQGVLSFSTHVLVGRLAWYVYTNADFFVAGLVFGKATLGAYTLAWQFASIPIEKVSGLVARVTPAIFAKAQDDNATLRRLLLNITEGLGFVTLPLTIGLALVAPELVRLLLGEKWLAAIGPLQLLALYASYRSLVTVLPQILTVKGDARWSMWLGVWTAIALPAGFAVGSRFGPTGIAATWIVIYPLFTIPLFRRTFRRIELTPWPYIRVLLPSLRGTAAMALVVVSIGAVVPPSVPPTLRLVSLVVAGVLVYALTTVRPQLGRMRRLLTSLRRSPNEQTSPSLAME